MTKTGCTKNLLDWAAIVYTVTQKYSTRQNAIFQQLSLLDIFTLNCLNSRKFGEN